MDTVFRFETQRYTLSLKRDERGWAVTMSAGAGKETDIVTTSKFEYAVDAFNNEIKKAEMTTRC